MGCWLGGNNKFFFFQKFNKSSVVLTQVEFCQFHIEYAVSKLISSLLFFHFTLFVLVVEEFCNFTRVFFVKLHN